MTYRDELIKAMGILAKDERTIFLGQEIITNQFYRTMGEVPEEKMIETPIMEDVQLGICTGLALEGYLPVCLYTRMDFFLLAFNQLINHLDKIESMSHGEFNPKVIIRVVVGADKPMDPGPQHTQNFTKMLACQLQNINLFDLNNSDAIIPVYTKALESKRSSLIVEYQGLYNKEARMVFGNDTIVGK